MSGITVSISNLSMTKYSDGKNGIEHDTSVVGSFYIRTSGIVGQNTSGFFTVGHESATDFFKIDTGVAVFGAGSSVNSVFVSNRANSLDPDVPTHSESYIQLSKLPNFTLAKDGTKSIVVTGQAVFTCIDKLLQSEEIFDNAGQGTGNGILRVIGATTSSLMTITVRP